VVGVGLIVACDFSPSLKNLEQALRIYDEAKLSSLAQVYAHEPASRRSDSCELGTLVIGLSRSRLKEISQGTSFGATAQPSIYFRDGGRFASWFHQFNRNIRAVEESASETISISAQHDFVFYRAWGLIMQGWALAQRNQVLEGISQMRAGLEAYRTTGGGSIMPSFLGLLAEAYGKIVETDRALNVLEEAMGLADENEEHWWQAELLRLKGELLPMHENLPNSSDVSNAVECLRQSKSHRQHAKGQISRAAFRHESLLRLDAPTRAARVAMGAAGGFRAFHQRI
jgi:hypothetical protein